MRRVAITNRKGGTAKTTTAVNLAAALRNLGMWVEVVDCDDQQHANRWVGIKPSTTILDDIARAEKTPADVVLFDCPPAVSQESIAAVMASTDILVPVEVSPMAVQGLFDLVDELHTIRPDLPAPLVVFVRADFREALTREVLEIVRDDRRIHPLEVVVRNNVRLKEAYAHQKTIFDYDSRSYGAQDYEALARELTQIWGVDIDSTAGEKWHAPR